VAHAWIVGSGLAAAASAYELRQAGLTSFVFEQDDRWGGLVRSDRLGGVIYEPNGSHILHTEDKEVWELLSGLVPFNSYEHRVQTMVRGELLTWPIQEDEVRRVYGDGIADHLIDMNAPDHHGQYVNRRPVFNPRATLNFEEWCLRMMSREVYDDFVKPYTEKQWGRSAKRLAADFAPKRVQVRSDGDDRLFKDPYQGFPDGEQDASWSDVLEALFGPALSPAHMLLDTRMTLTRLTAMIERYPKAWRPDVVVVTAPLDDFSGNRYGRMDWRGLVFDHKLVHRPDDGFVQSRAVINWPGKEFPWIRTHETKHMSGQQVRDSVLTTEFPGGPAKMYPVPGADGRNRTRNLRYQDLIRGRVEKLGPRCLFVGRLASFAYMDTDEVVRQALDEVRSFLGATVPA